MISQIIYDAGKMAAGILPGNVVTSVVRELTKGHYQKAGSASIIIILNYVQLILWRNWLACTVGRDEILPGNRLSILPGHVDI